MGRPWLRFLLAQLAAAGDGSGRFEQLATALVHRRKAANIIPATPPSYGGDLGADARTGPVLLDSESLLRLYSSPPTAGAKWVFAFSISADWKQKLRADVQKILANNLEPERIVFVTSQLIAPERVKIETERAFSDTHSVTVEILDGSWIELHLLADDYQLAVRYLGAPPINDPEMRSFVQRVFGLKRAGLDAVEALEVERLKQELQYRNRYLSNREHFFRDIGSLAAILAEREAMLPEALDWYREAWSVALDSTPTPASMRTAYCYLRTLFRDPSLLSEMFRNTSLYVDMVIASNRPYFASDALTLLMFLAPHSAGNPIWDDTAAKLRAWCAAAPSRGYGLASNVHAVDVVLMLDLFHAVRAQNSPPIGQILRRLRSLLKKYRALTMFDVERWSKTLAVLAPLIGEDPAYPSVYDLATELVSTKAGMKAKAHVDKERAVSLARAGRWREALQFALRTQRAWFSEHELPSFIRSCRFAALCLRTLNYYWAALAELLTAWHVITADPQHAHLDALPDLCLSLYNNALDRGRPIEAVTWMRRYYGACEFARVAPDPEVGPFFRSAVAMLLAGLRQSLPSAHDSLLARVDAIFPGLSDFYREVCLAPEAQFAEWLADPALSDSARADATTLRRELRAAGPALERHDDEEAARVSMRTTWRHAGGTSSLSVTAPRDGASQALALDMVVLLEMWAACGQGAAVCVVDEQIGVEILPRADINELFMNRKDDDTIVIAYRDSKYQALLAQPTTAALLEALKCIAYIAVQATIDPFESVMETLSPPAFSSVMETICIVAPPGYIWRVVVES